jgi:ring-1,2-phenylacetyl-CoA epoxidase subunit PaaC
VLLAERADDDFAHLVARLCAFSVWRLELLQRLTESRDPMLAAIAAKGVKEVTYHRDYAAQWVVRLGDGTELSRRRMSAAVEALQPLLGELFQPHPVSSRLAEAGVAVDPASVRVAFDEVWAYVLTTATLDSAVSSSFPQGGRDGVHTPELGEILDEMQGLARSTPGGSW